MTGSTEQPYHFERKRFRPSQQKHDNDNEHIIIQDLLETILSIVCWTSPASILLDHRMYNHIVFLPDNCIS